MFSAKHFFLSVPLGIDAPLLSFMPLPLRNAHHSGDELVYHLLQCLVLRIVPAPPDVLARIPYLKTELTGRFVLHRRTIEDGGKSIRGFRLCIRTELANPFEKAKSNFLVEDLNPRGFPAIRGNRHR